MILHHSWGWGRNPGKTPDFWWADLCEGGTALRWLGQACMAHWHCWGWSSRTWGTWSTSWGLNTDDFGHKGAVEEAQLAHRREGVGRGGVAGSHWWRWMSLCDPHWHDWHDFQRGHHFSGRRRGKREKFMHWYILQTLCEDILWYW